MDDRTIIRPGGRPKKSRQSSSDPGKTSLRSDGRQRTSLADLVKENNKASPFKKSSSQEPASDKTIHKVDISDLRTQLSPILLLVTEVRKARSEPNLSELWVKVYEDLAHLRAANFEQVSTFQGYEEVSYGLCCYIDEVILNTPWGASSRWASESMLVTFHKETWGGERFFEFLEKMKLAPSTYIATLEVYYALLELGFEGKFRHQSDGQRKLNDIKDTTFYAISQYRSLENQPLSDRWEPVLQNNSTYLKVIPQWVIWTVAASCCLVIFFLFKMTLSNKSDPAKRALVALQNIGHISVPARQNPSVISTTNYGLNDNASIIYRSLSQSLEDELEAGIFEIFKKPDGVVLRLSKSDLFRSGSNTLGAKYVGALERLGSSLATLSSTLVINGHSDDIPIRTIKYPDNWALSEARAISVKEIIAPFLNGSTHIQAKGLADTINIVPNNTPQNRAINRRVEILIKA